MFIRWTFAIGDKNLGIEIREEAEDERIIACINSGEDLLYVPSEGKEAYINLKLCNVIIRDVIQEDAPKQEEKVDTGPAVD